MLLLLQILVLGLNILAEVLQCIYTIHVVLDYECHEGRLLYGVHCINPSSQEPSPAPLCHGPQKAVAILCIVYRRKCLLS